MSTPRVYGYTHDGEDDVGWGCVYRSAQNVMSHAGFAVWPIKALCAGIGRKWGTWSEPADYKKIFPTSAVGILAGHSRQWLKLTNREDYDEVLSVEELERRIIAGTAVGKSYIIDDGISGHSVVSYENKAWFIDPHTSKPKRVPLGDTLWTRSGWMVLEVNPADVSHIGPS